MKAVTRSEAAVTKAIMKAMTRDKGIDQGFSSSDEGNDQDWPIIHVLERELTRIDQDCMT